MSLELKPVSAETAAAFEHWQLLIRLIRKSEAMISLAMARIERAKRLRDQASPVPNGTEAAILAQAVTYEREAYMYLTAVPAYYQFFQTELANVRLQIERGIQND